MTEAIEPRWTCPECGISFARYHDYATHDYARHYKDRLARRLRRRKDDS